MLIWLPKLKQLLILATNVISEEAEVLKLGYPVLCTKATIVITESFNSCDCELDVMLLEKILCVYV